MTIFYHITPAAGLYVTPEEYHQDNSGQMAEQWGKFKNTYLDWQLKYQDQDIPFKLNEENRRVDIDCSLDELFNEWKKLFEELSRLIDIGLCLNRYARLGSADAFLVPSKYTELLQFKFKKEQEVLNQEQKEFEKNYQKPVNQLPLNFSFSGKSTDVLIKKIAANDTLQYLIIAEMYHDQTASYCWLDDNKYELVKAGYNTIAMEFYGMWQQEELDKFFNNEINKAPFPDKPTSYTLVPECNKWLHAKGNMLKIFKSVNIHAIGIESEQSINTSALYAKDRLEVLDRTLPFALNKNGLLQFAGNESEIQSKPKVLIWVGAGHARGMVQWLGREKCLVIGIENSKKCKKEYIALNQKIAGEVFDLLIQVPYQKYPFKGERLGRSFDTDQIRTLRDDIEDRFCVTHHHNVEIRNQNQTAIKLTFPQNIEKNDFVGFLKKHSLYKEIQPKYLIGDQGIFGKKNFYLTFEKRSLNNNFDSKNCFNELLDYLIREGMRTADFVSTQEYQKISSERHRYEQQLTHYKLIHHFMTQTIIDIDSNRTTIDSMRSQLHDLLLFDAQLAKFDSSKLYFMSSSNQYLTLIKNLKLLSSEKLYSQFRAAEERRCGMQHTYLIEPSDTNSNLLENESISFVSK